MDSVFPVGSCPLLCSAVALDRGWSSARDSVWRLEIPGRAPEPPPSDTLSALHHQHDFHCSPRAGGAPSGKKQTNMEAVGVQVYRPCSFDSLWVWPAASVILLACVKAWFWNVSVCVQHDMYTWRTVCTELCVGGVYNHNFSRFLLVQGVLC